MTGLPPTLDDRFRSAAFAAGLVEVAYDVIETPLGEVLGAATDHGLLRLSFDADPDVHLRELADLIGARVLQAPKALDPTRRELDEYFCSSRTSFDLTVDLRGVTPFSRAVLTELSKVPYGTTATYAQLAERAGNPKGARAVGMVMNRNRVPIVLPCHRIVGTSGNLTGYAGGLERKEALLRLEGAVL